MNLDLNELANGLAGVLRKSINKDLPEIKEYAQRIVLSERQVLERLAQLFAAGEITEDELRSELQDEEATVKNQLLAIKEMSEAAAQRATNAALKFLGDALLKAIGG